METMEEERTMQKVILNRRSIRNYTKEPVTEEQIRALLEAGMSAPSAGNQRPWHFVVITDQAVREEIPRLHPHAGMVPHAPVVIAVCADLRLERYAGYWPQDCAAATENILLSAEAQGLGAVWLGVHPDEDRMHKLGALLHLPEQVKLLSLVALGHPAEKKDHPSRFDPERVHRDRW